MEGVRLAFFPVGSLEQHGPHLPVGTDGIIAEAIARELSRRFHPSFLFPMLPVSASFEHFGFPGSFSLRVPTIYAYVKDLVDSMEYQGIRRCVIVNGHGGNHLLRNIVQELNIPKPKLLLVPSQKHWNAAYQDAGLSHTTSQDMHAGEGETSLLLYLTSEGTVREEHIRDVDSPGRPLLETLGMKAYTSTGTIGFPAKASQEKGKKLFHALMESISGTVEEFLKATD